MASDEKGLKLLKEEKASLLVAPKEEEETKRGSSPRNKRKTRIEIKVPLLSEKSAAPRTEEKREAYLSK